MRHLILFLISFLCFNFSGAQTDLEEVIFEEWLPEKMDSTWVLFNHRDSLQPAFRLDSVVVSSSQNFNSLGFITISNGKYGLFTFFNGGLFSIEHKYDSMFVAPNLLFRNKDNVWEYMHILDVFESKPENINTQFQKIGNVDSFFVDKGSVFYWQNGKQGLFTYRNHLKPKYKHVQCYNNANEIECFLVSDGVSFGLLKDENEVIPVQCEAVEQYKFGWFRYWNNDAGYWNYLTPDNRKIETNGCDLVVYSGNEYKIYNKERSKSKYFINNRELSFGYEDYFLKGGNYLAVRQNGKIGLIESNGVVKISPQFDQIEILDNHRLRVFKDGSWYLADFNGTILTEKGFKAIGLFNAVMEEHSFVNGEISYFPAQGENGIGVLQDDGTLLIPAVYGSLAKRGKFFVVKDNGMKLYNEQGQLLTNETYDSYAESYGDFIVMQEKGGYFDLLSTSGKINESAFERYVKYQGAFKCYRPSGFELIVMDEVDSTKVAEIQRFDLSSTVTIQKLDSLRTYDQLWRFSDGELEETQLTGLWNLRENKTAKNSNSNWKEVLGHSWMGHDVLAISQYKKRSVQMPFGPEMIAYYDGVLIDKTSYSINTKFIISTTEEQYFSDTRSSYDHLVSGTDGKQFWYGPTTENNGIDPGRIFSLDYCLKFGFVATLAESAEIREDPQSNLSVFDWWISKNELFNLTPVSANISTVMNPKLKLIPTKVNIQLSSILSESPKRTKRLGNGNYREFYNLSAQDVFDGNKFAARKWNDDSLTFFDYHMDSTTVYNYAGVEFNQNNFMIVDGFKQLVGYKHFSEPDFVFDPSDSSNFTKNFVYGRITETNGDSVSLQTVKGEKIFDGMGRIQPIDNGLLVVQNDTESLIIDRNGRLIQQLSTGQIVAGEYSFALITADSIVWYDYQLNLLQTVQGGSLTKISDDVWMIERFKESTLYNEKGEFITILLENESFNSNKWLVRKTAQGWSYRIPKSDKVFTFNSKPEENLNFIIAKNGNYYELIDKRGNVLVSKKQKLDSKYEKGLFYVLSNSKVFYVIGDNGEIIYNGKYFKTAVEMDDTLFVETKDTLVKVSKPSVVAKIRMTDGEIGYSADANELVVFGPQKGLAFNYGKTILDPLYRGIHLMNESTIVVQQGNRYYSYKIGEGFVKPEYTSTKIP